MTRKPFIIAIAVLLIVIMGSEICLAINVPRITRDLQGALWEKGDPEEIAPELLQFLALYLASTDDVVKALEYVSRARQYGIKEYYEIAIRLLETSDKLLASSIKQHGKMMAVWKERGIFSELDDGSIPYLRERKQFETVRKDLETRVGYLLGYLIEHGIIEKGFFEDQWDKKISKIRENDTRALQESIHQDLIEMKEAVGQMRNEILAEMKEPPEPGKEGEGVTPPRWTHWHSVAFGACIGAAATVSIVTWCTGTVAAWSIAGSVLTAIVTSTYIP